MTLYQFMKYHRFTLRKQCSIMELFLVHIFLYLDRIERDTLCLSVSSPNTGRFGPQITLFSDTFHTVLLTGDNKECSK